MEIERIKKYILHYNKKFPVGYKYFRRAWSEGFISGIFQADKITSEVFDQLLIWVRQQ